jgi:hypothetical protein
MNVPAVVRLDSERVPDFEWQRNHRLRDADHHDQQHPGACGVPSKRTRPLVQPAESSERPETNEQRE